MRLTITITYPHKIFYDIKALKKLLLLEVWTNSPYTKKYTTTYYTLLG